MDKEYKDQGEIELMNVMDISEIIPVKRYLVQTMVRDIWADEVFGAYSPGSYVILGNAGPDGNMIYTKVCGAELVVHDFWFVGPDGKPITIEDYKKLVGEMTTQMQQQTGTPDDDAFR